MSIKSVFQYLLNPRVEMHKLPASLKPVGNGSAFETLPRRPLWIQVRRVLFNLPLMVGVLSVVGMLLVVLFGPLWSTHDHFITAQETLPHYDAQLKLMVTPPFPPSAEHPLGTDQWGNDLLSLILMGARVTLVVGAYITVARLFLGVVLGSLAGWKAGTAADRAVMGFAGVIGSVPMLLSSMILIYAVGIQKGTWVFIAALTVVGWTEIAEMIRGEMLIIREKTYIEGAQAVGLNGLQLVVRHAFPNLVAQILVMSALEMGAVLVLLAELGFLSTYIGGGSTFTLDPAFGRRPVLLMEVPEWGAMLGIGSPSLRSAYWMVLAPALAFFVSVAGFNALGEGLRRFMNRSSVNTAVLLKKRTLLVGIVLVVIATMIINYTGPILSFKRAASTFNASQAQDFSGRLSSLSPSGPTDSEDNPPVAYIIEKFKEAGLERGIRSAVASSYLTMVEVQRGGEAVQVPLVVGYLPGYDNVIADDLAVIMAGFDGVPGADEAAQIEPAQHEPGASGVGLLIEMAYVWQEQDIGGRRSVLFVAWGGGASDFSGARAFLDNSRNFETLPIPSRQPVVPTMVVQIAGETAEIPAGNASLWLLPESDEKLARLLTASAKEMGVDLSSPPAPSTPDPDSVSPSFPSLFLRWAVPASGEFQGEVGQMLTLSLIKVVRQLNY